MKKLSGMTVSGTSNTAILPASEPGAGRAAGLDVARAAPSRPAAGVWPEYGM